MVFAAGRGTRLGDLTRDRPKALVEVDGRPLIEHVLANLLQAGVERVVVNAHHHAERLVSWAAARRGPPEVVLSIERDELLDTGGGLAAARALLSGRGPLIVHNVDVLTPLDLARVVLAHEAGGWDATLVTSARPSRRGLWFDDHGLFGHLDETRDAAETVRAPRGNVVRRAFQGISVVSRSFVERLGPPRVAPITRLWLDDAATGRRLDAFDMDPVPWFDVGRPEDLARASAAFSRRPASP